MQRALAFHVGAHWYLHLALAFGYSAVLGESATTNFLQTKAVCRFAVHKLKILQTSGFRRFHGSNSADWKILQNCCNRTKKINRSFFLQEPLALRSFALIAEHNY